MDGQETDEGARTGSAARRENLQTCDSSGGEVPGGDGPARSKAAVRVSVSPQTITNNAA